MNARAEFLRASYADRRRQRRFDGGVILAGRCVLVLVILSIVAVWVLR